MDYTMEDTQNAAPDALQASKLNSSAQRNDTQSVTKRFVRIYNQAIYCGDLSEPGVLT